MIPSSSSSSEAGREDDDIFGAAHLQTAVAASGEDALAPSGDEGASRLPEEPDVSYEEAELMSFVEDDGSSSSSNIEGVSTTDDEPLTPAVFAHGPEDGLLIEALDASNFELLVKSVETILVNFDWEGQCGILVVLCKCISLMFLRAYVYFNLYGFFESRGWTKGGRQC